MRELNNNFLDLYKRVDRFLQDSYSTDRGVSSYIELMEENNWKGLRSTISWENDYRMLKHIRWLRNQLAHEVELDSDLCDEKDFSWLSSFYDRLYSSNDPLSLMYQEDIKRQQREQAQDRAKRVYQRKEAVRQKSEQAKAQQSINEDRNAEKVYYRCSTCSQLVDEELNSCPYCGAPKVFIKKKNRKGFGWLVALIVIALLGYAAVRNYGDVVYQYFTCKPEDAVDEFMTQDNLIGLLTDYEDSLVENDSRTAKSIYRTFTDPKMKALLLENARSTTYSITDVAKNGNSATVTAVIMHRDMTPVVERTMLIFLTKIAEMATEAEESPEEIEEDAEPIEYGETELDQAGEFVFEIIHESLIEALFETEPSETYTKFRFQCYRTPTFKWELEDVPDEFFQKVLLMNYSDAMDKIISN